MLNIGHAAFKIKLPNLQPILQTGTYLMDHLTGQFYAVYNYGYRKMATTKKMLYLWQNGQLKAELQETRWKFGLPPQPEASPAHHSTAKQCFSQSAIQQSQS